MFLIFQLICSQFIRLQILFQGKQSCLLFIFVSWNWGPFTIVATGKVDHHAHLNLFSHFVVEPPLNVLLGHSTELTKLRHEIWSLKLLLWLQLSKLWSLIICLFLFLMVFVLGVFLASILKVLLLRKNLGELLKVFNLFTMMLQVLFLPCHFKVPVICLHPLMTTPNKLGSTFQRTKVRLLTLFLKQSGNVYQMFAESQRHNGVEYVNLKFEDYSALIVFTCNIWCSTVHNKMILPLFFNCYKHFVHGYLSWPCSRDPVLESSLLFNTHLSFT